MRAIPKIISPDSGGSPPPCAEEVRVTWAAMQLNRLAKWIEDRANFFVATTHERGQIHDAEVAFDKDSHILGMHNVFLRNAGTYAPYGLTVAFDAQAYVLGLYDIKNYHGGLHQQDHRHLAIRHTARHFRHSTRWA